MVQLRRRLQLQRLQLLPMHQQRKTRATVRVGPVLFRFYSSKKTRSTLSRAHNNQQRTSSILINARNGNPGTRFHTRLYFLKSWNQRKFKFGIYVSCSLRLLKVTLVSCTVPSCAWLRSPLTLYWVTRLLSVRVTTHAGPATQTEWCRLHPFSLGRGQFPLAYMPRPRRNHW